MQVCDVYTYVVGRDAFLMPRLRVGGPRLMASTVCSLEPGRSRDPTISETCPSGEDVAQTLGRLKWGRSPFQSRISPVPAADATVHPRARA